MVANLILVSILTFSHLGDGDWDWDWVGLGAFD